MLLLDKSAPESVLAGQRIVYRIRYSVSYVEAKNLVVWDKLPLKADGTMTYPAEHGQNDVSPLLKLRRAAPTRRCR